MMEPQRLLTRLNPITIDWQNTSRTTGSVLTSEEIAACLAGLARGPYLLIRYLWCQDHTVTVELFHLLLQESTRLAHKHNWGCKNNSQRLSALIKMALYEMEKVNLCKPCKGTGVKINVICATCNGSGTKKPSQAEYAQYCGVKRPNWLRHWAEKYQEIYLSIAEWNERGINHMLARL
jgi:hypothetical protein